MSLDIGTATNAIAAIKQRGWASLRATANSARGFKQELVEIAERLGQIVSSPRWQLTAILTPSTCSLRRPTSLSGKFGLGEFPLHCDTAFWPVPCRFILLACEARGNADVATVLLDTEVMELSTIEKDLATRALFFIRNGPRSFYSSILSPHRTFVRVDPGCFEPVDAEGRTALALFNRRRWESHLHRISWSRGDVLLIDNWRVLHGREALMEAHGGRRLTRILIR